MTRAALRSILERAIGYAVATLVVALMLAAFLSDAAAERFATTAYLSAIVIGLALAIRHLLPAREIGARKTLAVFPAVLNFCAMTIVFVAIGAAFVSDPRTEVAIVVGFGILVALRALMRSRWLAFAFAWLVRGGALAGTINCAALVLVAASVAAARAPSPDAELFAKLAYGAAAAILVALAVSQFAATRLGRDLRATGARAAALLRSPASAAVVVATVRYAAATVVASLLLALLSGEPTAERFATCAYVAAIFAGGAKVASWRLRALVPASAQMLDAAALPGIAGSALAFSLIGAALAGRASAVLLAIPVCLALILANIAVRAGVLNLPQALAAFSRRAASLRDRTSAAFTHTAALSTIVRYCAFTAAIALALTAFAPQAFAGRAVLLAYAAAIGAALALGVERFLRSA